MALSIDITRFPVVVWRLGSTSFEPAELRAQCESHLSELSTHRGIFVCVHDWTHAGELEPDCWRVVFDHAILSASLSSQCVAQAVAVTSPALRGFATARSLNHPFSFAVRVATSYEAALSWCAWQLKRSEPQAV